MPEGLLQKSEREQEKNYHLIELAPKQGATGPLTSANAELLIDGEPVKGCRRVIIQLDAKGVAVVQIELYAHLRFAAIGEVQEVIVPINIPDPTPKT